VGDADRAGMAELTGPLHPGPGPGRTTLRPVNQVQVDVVEAEAFEAALELRSRIGAGRIQLCGDEHLVTRDAALPERYADAFLVAIHLSSVNVSVAELQCPAYGVHARGPVRDLPHPEAESRTLVAVREQAQVRIRGLWRR